MKTATKRLQAARGRLNRLPYRYEVIDQAYARFLEDGTLPADDAVAGRVLHRVLHARKPLPPDPDAVALHQPYGTTREMLFREAVCSVQPARDIARQLLEVLVQAGHDPTDPELIGPELEPWDFATTSMRLLGWPHHYVRPQYHAQLDRLLHRQAAERAGRPRNDPDWERGAAQALAAFLRSGVVPADARFFSYVMGIAEQFALTQQFAGRPVEELLAAFDAIATGNATERATALQRIGVLQARASEVRR